MIWPPKSPDLNPIEKLWDELDRKVHMMAPTSVQSLWKCLKDAWKNLNCEMMEKMVSGMPNLCKAVIHTKGGHIDECKI